jgi:hypothetical protein
MNFKTTGLLFAILIGVLWGFGLMLALKKEAPDESFVLPGMHVPKKEVSRDDVSVVEVERDGKKATFVKNDQGQWRMRFQNFEVRADGNKIDSLIDEVRDARKDEDVDVTSNLKQFGLDRPRTRVTLKTKGVGQEWTLNLGKTRADDAYIFVNSSERPKEVLPVKKSSLRNVEFKDINEFRPRNLLAVKEGNSKDVALRGGKDTKDRVVLNKTATGAWLLKVPPYGLADVEGDPGTDKDAKKMPGVRGLLDAIGSIYAESEADLVPLGEKNIADYGLEDGRSLYRIQVEHAIEGQEQKGKTITETLLIGNPVSDKKEKYYARLSNEEAVMQVPAKKLETVIQVLDDPKILRNHDLAESREPDVIEIAESGKDPVKLWSPAPTLWKVALGKEPPRKGNASEIQGLVSTLQGKRQVKEFVDDKKSDADLGLAKPKATVSLYVEALQKETEKKEDKKTDKKDEKKDTETGPKLKKDAKPAVVLTFGDTRGDLVYVKRKMADGTDIRLAVPVAVLTKVQQDPLTYLDDALATFSTADVTKLELKRGSEELVAEKDDKRDWQLKKPEKTPNDRHKADLEGVFRVLETLKDLRVKKWVKKITTDDLKQNGLNPPLLQATVTLKEKDKPITRVYQFGSETKDGTYGREQGNDLLFLIDTKEAKVLQETELRDRTVFDFDAAKVKELKIKQWDPIRSEDFTVVFERKDNAWTPKSGVGKDWNPDSNKITVLLNKLAHLQAVRYEGEPKEAYKVQDPKIKRTVEVLLDTGKWRTLVLGAENPEKTGYYAQSSFDKDAVVANVVFLVRASDFRELVDKGVLAVKKE